MLRARGWGPVVHGSTVPAAALAGPPTVKWLPHVRQVALLVDTDTGTLLWMKHRYADRGKSNIMASYQAPVPGHALQFLLLQAHGDAWMPGPYRGLLEDPVGARGPRAVARAPWSLQRYSATRHFEAIAAIHFRTQAAQPAQE